MNTALKYSCAVCVCTALALSIAVVANSAVETSQDKYTLKVPGGMAFSEFKGYEAWETVSTSQTDKAIAVIVANPVMIAAFKAGAPGNGKPFPDGSKMAKVHWNPKKSETFAGPIVPGTLRDVDFMQKDSTRFADSGGWGYAVFKYDTATDKFALGTTADQQSDDAKCGFACHTIVKARDYVFTEYGKR